MFSDEGLDADFDIADLSENPQDAREYAQRIMAYLRELEVTWGARHRPRPGADRAFFPTTLG